MSDTSERLRSFVDGAHGDLERLEKGAAGLAKRIVKYIRRRRVVKKGKLAWAYDYSDKKERPAKKGEEQVGWLRRRLKLRFKSLVSEIKAALERKLKRMEEQKAEAAAEPAEEKPKPERKLPAEPKKPTEKVVGKSLSQLDQERRDLITQISEASKHDTGWAEYKAMLAELRRLGEQIEKLQKTEQRKRVPATTPSEPGKAGGKVADKKTAAEPPTKPATERRQEEAREYLSDVQSAMRDKMKQLGSGDLHDEIKANLDKSKRWPFIGVALFTVMKEWTAQYGLDVPGWDTAAFTRPIVLRPGEPTPGYQSAKTGEKRAPKAKPAPKAEAKPAPKPKPEPAPKPEPPKAEQLPAKPEVETTYTDVDARADGQPGAPDPGPPGKVSVSVPAIKGHTGWAKMVRGTRDKGPRGRAPKGGYHFDGESLKTGQKHDLAPGDMVLVADKSGGTPKRTRRGRMYYAGATVTATLSVVNDTGGLDTVDTKVGPGWGRALKQHAQRILEGREVEAEGQAAAAQPEPEVPEETATPEAAAAPTPAEKPKPTPAVDPLDAHPERKHPQDAEMTLPPIAAQPDLTGKHRAVSRNLRKIRTKIAGRWEKAPPSNETAALGGVVKAIDGMLSKVEAGEPIPLPIRALGVVQWGLLAESVMANKYGLPDPIDAEQRRDLMARINETRKADQEAAKAAEASAQDAQDALAEQRQKEEPGSPKAETLAAEQRDVAPDRATPPEQVQSKADKATKKHGKPEKPTATDKPTEDGWERMPPSEGGGAPTATVAGAPEPPPKAGGPPKDGDGPSDGDVRVEHGRMYRYDGDAAQWVRVEPSDEAEHKQRLDERVKRLRDRVVKTKPFGSRPGWGSKTRDKKNREAAALAEKLAKSGKKPTAAERKILEGYSGYGSDSQASMKRADLTEFYTPAEVGTVMWEILQDLGLREGHSVLEPSCGAGAIINTAPEGVKVVGVEMQQESATVAKVLHEPNGHEIWHSPREAGGFEGFAEVDGRKFDFVIGNPPFGKRGHTQNFDASKSDIKKLEQYFADTCLDKLNDGGYLAFLVPASFMTGRGPDNIAMRERLMTKGSLVTAHRLPESTFGNSQSFMGGDLVVLKKHPADVANGLRGADAELLRKAGLMDQEFVDGRYFTGRGKENIHGEQYKATGRMASSKTQVKGDLNADVYEAIFRGKRDTPPEVTYESVYAVADGMQRERMDRERQRQPYELAQVGDTREDAEGNTLVRVPGNLWVNPEDVPPGVKWKKQAGSVEAALPIARDIRALSEAMNAGDRLKVTEMQRKVKPALNAFVNDYGVPWEIQDLHADKKNARDLAHLLAVVNKDGTYSTLLDRQPIVLRKADKVNTQDPVSVAEALCRRVKSITPEDHARIWEKGDADAARAFLVGHKEFCQEADGKWVHKADYLGGNVYDKLDDLKRQRKAAKGDKALLSKLDKQEDMLKKNVAENWRTLEDVQVEMREGWVGADVLTDFLQDLLRTGGVAGDKTIESAHVEITKGVYIVKGIDPRDYDNVKAWEKWLNRGQMGGLGPDQKAHVAEIKELWSAWLPGSKHAEKMERDYNRRFNAERDRAYSTEVADIKMGSDWSLGDERNRLNDLLAKSEKALKAAKSKAAKTKHASIKDGLERKLAFVRERIDDEGAESRWIKLHPYQASAVNRMLEQGKGILAHDVGLGKTFSSLYLAAMLREQGKRKKICCSVPKSVLGNWLREAEALIPGAKIHVVGMHPKKRGEGWVESSAAQKKRQWTEAAQGDFDIILTNQENLDAIELTPERRHEYAQRDFFSGERALEVERLKNKRSKSGEPSKKYEQLVRQQEQKEAEARYKRRKGDIFFEDLGIDCIMVDEGHRYKNMYEPKSREGAKPQFMGGGRDAKRSRALLQKSMYLREQNADGGGMYMLTATPVKNSPMEVFNMIQYTNPEELERRGIRNHEEFLDRYCDLEERLIANSKGEMEKKLVVAGFKNLDELRQMMGVAMEKKTGAEVGLKLPEAKVRNHNFEVSSEQKEVLADVRRRLSNFLAGGDPEPEEISAKGKDERGFLGYLSQLDKAGADIGLLRQVGPEHKDFWKRSPKYKAVTSQVMERYKDGTSGQIIFSDVKQSNEHIKQHLVDAGIPEDQIEILNNDTAKKTEQRLAIANRFREGKTRIVIGTTAVMGEGINLQDNCSDIHHVDSSWEPGTFQQRNGRGVRQGNKLESVDVHYYLAEAALDGYRYQMVEGKASWQSQLYQGGDKMRTGLAGFSRDEMAVMAAADPEAARQKIEENHKRAREIYAESRKAEAKTTFADLQRFKQTYLQYADKTSPRAVASKNKITALTRRLKGNEFFDHQDLLDVKEPVLLHHGTGRTLKPGDIIKTDYGGNYVVDAVNARYETATIHRYGAPSTKHTVTAKDLARKRFSVSEHTRPRFEFTDEKYDRKAEFNTILEQCYSPADFVGVHDDILKGNHAQIQAKMKSTAQDHPGYRTDYWGKKVPNRYNADGWLATDGKTIRALNVNDRLREGEEIMLPTSGNAEKLRSAFEAGIRDRFKSDLARHQAQGLTRKEALKKMSSESHDYKQAFRFGKDVEAVHDKLKDWYGSVMYSEVGFHRWLSKKRKGLKKASGPVPWRQGATMAKMLRTFTRDAREMIH